MELTQVKFDFHFIDWSEVGKENGAVQTDTENYNQIIAWAGKARGINPRVFDALTEWVLDDSQWTDDKLADNERVLMQGVFARFKKQNKKLRAYLKELEPSGVVNVPVFGALDAFDKELSPQPDFERFRQVAAKIFTDFSAMRERGVRELIAGGKTGATGTDSVETYGYVNHLKDCDAQVQWTLFMPSMVERQQREFKVESFEYKKMPAMRFVGRECGREGDNLDNAEVRKELFCVLDGMGEHKSGFDHDVLFMHHYGRGVDVERWHGFWGRFMKADAPVPEGFVHFDLVEHNDGKAGLPFVSQFALATFSGDTDAMHKREGYDSDAMYDVTRNIILGQSVCIPYPQKYWTAEVFLNGHAKPSTAYMFGIER